MASGRETDHADSLGIDCPIGRLAANKADGPLGVEQRPWRWVGTNFARPTWDAVLENDAGDADGIQPGRNFFAFQFPKQVPVATTRADDHGRAGVLGVGGTVNRERRLGDVRDELRRADDGGLMNPTRFFALDAYVSRR